MAGDLVAAAERASLTVAYPADLVVRTSGRRHGRVDGGGFHRFLAELEPGGSPRDRVMDPAAAASRGSTGS